MRTCEFCVQKRETQTTNRLPFSCIYRWLCADCLQLLIWKHRTGEH